MKKHFLLACLLMAMGGVYPDVVNAQCGDNGDGTFSNPVFWADVPDPDVIRVGDDFYMVSTTMHLVPGAPIMHSKDLVNWEIVSYLYDRLDDKPNYDLKEGTETPDLLLHGGGFLRPHLGGTAQKARADRPDY